MLITIFYNLLLFHFFPIFLLEMLNWFRFKRYFDSNSSILIDLDRFDSFNEKEKINNMNQINSITFGGDLDKII